MDRIRTYFTQDENRPSYTLIVGVGVGVTLLITLSTWLGIPASADWRAVVYAAAGLLATVAIALSAEKIQVDIRNFLMERVNNRRDRTAAVIDLCQKARQEFRAVTFFPVVGIQDDPRSAPREYLNSLEERLDDDVEVVLISVSCEEARTYCENRGFKGASIDALIWVERRMTELVDRFAHLTVITVPASAITVNVCHNDSTALMYHISPEKNDDGSGFKSTDPLIVAVAKGGATRYETYSQRHPG